MTSRNMQNYLSGMFQPKETLEKVFVNLNNTESDTMLECFGLLSNIQYNTHHMQFGVIADPPNLQGIAQKIVEAFEKEGFSEKKEWLKKREVEMRIGLQKDREHYVATISLKPYDTKLPFFNYTINVRKLIG